MSELEPSWPELSPRPVKAPASASEPPTVPGSRYAADTVALAVAAFLFILTAQFALSFVAFFGPDRGELEWPFPVLFVVASTIALVLAARRDAPLLGLRAVEAIVGLLCWGALSIMLVFAAGSPFELVNVPVWLNPSVPAYLIRPALWLPLHLLHALGPICLVAAYSASHAPPRSRARLLCLGALPWVLASVLYGAILMLERPVFLG